MGARYFKDKRYLESAKRTVNYLEKELISKSDYFSSTLDANCEDKEASLYASTAAYYLALVSKGAEREHYAALAKKAAYFALSGTILGMYPLHRGRCWVTWGLKLVVGAMSPSKIITSMYLFLNLLLFSTGFRRNMASPVFLSLLR